MRSDAVDREAQAMAEVNSRYSVGNIVGVVLVMLVSAGLAFYAIYDDSTSRIGRNSEFVVAFGVLGALWMGWTLIKAIRSRRR
jgi:hypothetical protein